MWPVDVHTASMALSNGDVDVVWNDTTDVNRATKSYKSTGING